MPHKQPIRWSALARWSTLAAASAVCGCGAVLDPQGPVGRAQNQILFNALAIMLAIVVPTICATLAFAWWFRASNRRAQFRPEFAYSGRIELVTWSIPVMVILFLGGITWIGSHELEPSKPLDVPGEVLEVQVVSLDWKWLFIYPQQGIATVNQLTIPAGRPVHFALTSASVMNAFFIPQLGSMIYTMNGMATQLNLMADRPGTLRGMSSHYSGDGFSDMHFAVSVVAPEQFGAWVDGVKADGPTLDTASYGALAEQSVPERPASYREVAPGLFDAVVTQKIASGPGPRGSDADVSPRRSR